MVTTDRAREIALGLPGTSEQTAYGRPCFLVDGKIFASIRDGDTELSVKVSDADKTSLVASDPDAFSVPAHYARSPMFVVRLDTVADERLESVLTAAWRLTAPADLVQRAGATD